MYKSANAKCIDVFKYRLTDIQTYKCTSTQAVEIIEMQVL